MRRSRTLPVLTTLGLLGAGFAGAVIAPAAAADDMPIISVAGSFNSEIGCGSDWQPDCAEAQLTYDVASGLYIGEFDIPVPADGEQYEYKYTQDGGWDVNWGQFGVAGADNIKLDVNPDGLTTFIFQPPAEVGGNAQVVAGATDTMYRAVGDMQVYFGCTDVWTPDCFKSVLFPQADGTLSRATTAIDTGSYQFKIVRANAWVNEYTWGLDGGSPGANIPFSTNTGEQVVFTFDRTTNMPGVTIENPPLPGSGYSNALWISADTVAWPTKLATDGATYELVGHPEITLTPGELTAEEKAAFPRTTTGFIALRMVKDGAPLTDAFAAELLKGGLVFEAKVGDDVVASTGAQIAGVIDDVYAAAKEADLGIVWNGNVPTLNLWAPTATDVSLHLWPVDGGGDATVIPATFDAATGVWSVEGQADWANYQYLWDVNVWVDSEGEVVHNLVTDPYSVGLTVNSLRSVIVNLDDDAWKPAGWDTTQDALPAMRNDAAQTIYELHVRDFSAIDETVTEANRGSYKAFTEAGSNGMQHLSELADAGMTTVHLLPTFDISTATIPEDRADQLVPDIPTDAGAASTAQQLAVSLVENQDAFNWGYDPMHWTTPEGSYATTGDQVGGARTLQYRQMVDALHQIGLRVVLDQVFNHTAAAGQDPMSVLDRVVPGYYHRLDLNGNIETSTCCQNIATENTMSEKIMIDSLVTWAKAYKVDGFRFDLMGHHSLENMTNVRAALDELTVENDGVDGKSIYIYGEGWDFGEVQGGALFQQAIQTEIANTGIGAFNDRLRDAVRGGGPFDEDQRTEQGFGTGLYTDMNATAAAKYPDAEALLPNLLHQTDLIRIGMAGSLADYSFLTSDGTVKTGEELQYNGVPAGYTAQPSESVNYVDAHDNETLFDNGIWKLPTDSTMDTRVRMDVLSSATVTLGQSPSFWHAGSEILRSKSLDRDSYNSGDHFNAVDWTLDTNVFGTGLPMASKNQEKWPMMIPLLEDASNVPTTGAMELSYQMSLDLLRIRNSSPLFTLGDADLIKEKVTFPNAGPEATPGLLVMHIDDHDNKVDEELDGVLVVFNASPETITEAIDDQAGSPFELIDIQQEGADDVVKDTEWDGATGTITIPARTVAVLVEKAGSEPIPPVGPTEPPVEPTEPPVGPTEPPVGPTEPGDGNAVGGSNGGGLATTGATTAGLIALAVLLGAAGLGLAARRRGHSGS